MFSPLLELQQSTLARTDLIFCLNALELWGSFLEADLSYFTIAFIVVGVLQRLLGLASFIDELLWSTVSAVTRAYIAPVMCLKLMSTGCNKLDSQLISGRSGY
jgi:hypothetical protein